MSIFASRTKLTIPIPFDVPHTVTIQKLSGKDLDAAQYEHMTGIATGRGRNWATRFVRLAAAGTATDADATKVLSDPLAGFDRLELAKRGVKAWTYDEAGEPKHVTPAAIEDLDDEALDFFATEVLRLTKPARFTDPETEQKNDSSSSTAA